jgi:hypothetical protein
VFIDSVKCRDHHRAGFVKVAAVAEFNPVTDLGEQVGITGRNIFGIACIDKRIQVTVVGTLDPFGITQF